MKISPTRRRLLASLVVLVLGAAIGGGLAVAAGVLATANSPNAVTVCVTNTGGQMRVVAPGAACKKGEHALVLQAAVAAGQTNFSVDCTAGQRIEDVLNQVATGTEPVVISVTGTCHESLNIGRDNVTLMVNQGNSATITPADAGDAVITVNGRNINLGGVTLSGGDTGIFGFAGSAFHAYGVTITGAQQGMTLTQGAMAMCEGVTITDAQGTGIEMQTGSMLSANGLTVQGSGGPGVHVWNGSTANLVGGLISDNDRDGVTVQGGSVANLQGVEITLNSQGGVNVMEGGQATLQGGTHVHDNTGSGVGISGGSSVAFQNDNVISHNSIDGVSLSDVSMASFGFGGDTNTVTDNGRWGVYCAGAAMISGTPGTLTGNTAGNNAC